MQSRSLLDTPGAVRDYLRLRLADRDHEVFHGLFLDSQNRLIADVELFRGTLTQTSGKRRPTPVLTPQTFSLSKRSFTADKSKCPGSKSSPHHARIS